MSYEPQVNHYVKWTKSVDGWIYFKCEEYVTIEYNVRPKDEVNLECCPIHKNDRLLVICYKEQWYQLEYVKSRKSVYEEEENCLAIAC